MSNTTPNFTKTDLREIADRADHREGTVTDFMDAYAQGVADVLRTIVGDARPTPELTAATQGALI